jgi:hypothetical protein
VKRISIYLVLILLALYSCSGKKKQLLIGTWHSIKIENPDIDYFFKNSQKYIDTIGKGHDAATNLALYGVTNMDSMRAVLQLQYDSVKMMQMKADTQTLFTFAKDSVATLTFPDRTQAGKWYFNKDTLILEGQDETGAIEKAGVEIVVLNDSLLKLKFIKTEQGVPDSSFVTFRRERK